MPSRPLAAVTTAAVLAAAVGCGGREADEREAPAPAVAAAPAASPTPAPYRALASVANGGTVSGVVTLAGPVPSLQPRPVTKDNEACGHGPMPNPSLSLGKNRGVADAIVRLVGVTAGKAFASAPAVLDQRKCTFVPHVQVVPAGTALSILNSDPVGHNVHAYDAENVSLFNIGTALQGVRVEQRLNQPGPVRLKCDAHSWMSGWIWVADTPYAVATDKDGRFTLAAVPPGAYELVVWHELLGEKRQPVTVPEKGSVTADVALSLAP